MDDLLLLAGELTENNNFKKDDFQEENKPDGHYNVILEKATLNVSDSTGTEWFRLTLKIIDGDYVEEKFYVNLFLTDKTVKRTLKIIMRLISSMQYEIDLAMFNDKNEILKGLQDLIGETTILSKTTANNGFINYSFVGGEE